ncbi:esterase-like activity of phytase family protein [Pseudooceanicola sp. MF1-13]|uniref:esterase-like activity of phytase family protein n=1 Tax=Pseudooceanicola sp. MF1-13 TaxID=3379095 RepID=UPI0038929724
MRFGSAVAVSLFLISGCVPTTPREDFARVSFDAVGGLSGLTVSDDGAGFVAISDRNTLIRGRFIRPDGVLRGVAIDSRDRLKDPQGRDLVGAWNDAEGLDETTDGTLWVSFEGQHRVARFGPDLRGTRLSDLPPIGDLKPNNGFEALALDPQGRAVIIMEKRKGRHDRTYVLRHDAGGWMRLADLRLEGGFLPVGADFGPDGRLYVLERLVSPIGFRSRIRQIEVMDEGEMEGRTLWTSNASLGNLEGLSLWTDDKGRVRATMVADDNESPALFGGFVEIILAKSPATL